MEHIDFIGPIPLDTPLMHGLIYALQAQRLEEQIVPILYETCDVDQLSWTLSSFQWIDFRKDLTKAVTTS